MTTTDIQLAAGVAISATVSLWAIAAWLRYALQPTRRTAVAAAAMTGLAAVLIEGLIYRYHPYSAPPIIVALIRAIAALFSVWTALYLADDLRRLRRLTS